MARLVIVFICLLVTLPTTAAERLISVDGAVTEILYVLGVGDRLVGVDTTSLYPSQARDLPSVGYKRSLSAEGILSLAPDRLLVTDDAGPPHVLEQLASAGPSIARIPNQPTLPGLMEKIRAVAVLVGREHEGEQLITRIERELTRLESLLSPGVAPPRVLFLLHTGSDRDIAAGRDTVADTVIGLAGGVNVLHEQISGYRPLNAESALAAAPQVILVTERTLAALGGVDGLLNRAGLRATPAGQARRIIAMDGSLLLTFGPRIGEAASVLAQALGSFVKDD